MCFGISFSAFPSLWVFSITMRFFRNQKVRDLSEQAVQNELDPQSGSAHLGSKRSVGHLSALTAPLTWELFHAFSE